MAVFQEWLRKWYFIPLLIFVSALAYLPHINQFGYFRDDWYLMYSANALGAKAFQGIYAIDRPARAILLSGLYSLFGINPLYYNISAYVFRVLGAFAFLWTLQMIWPRQRAASVVAAILFLIYPGFLSTPNAIDYQAQQLGFLLAHLSVAFSVKAVLGARRFYWIVLWLLSSLMVWAYLGFVEYFFGLEVFRFAAIALLVLRRPGMKLAQQAKSIFYRWLPFSVGTLGFVIWRFFFFDSERKATDLGAQLGLFADSPISVGTGWTITLLRNTFEALLLTWGVPLTNLWGISLRLREVLYAGILVALAVGAVAALLKFWKNDPEQSLEDENWRTEAYWIGLLCVVTGFVPVILSNREADFGNYSRYMLASSSGVVIVLMAFLDQFSSRTVRNVTVCMLVGVSVLTHHLNGIQWARASVAMQEFWWQVSWRIPQLTPGTTLVVNYSHSPVEEDYFIWGPANLIYHPQSMGPGKIRPVLWGALLSRESVMSMLKKAEPEAINRRSILTYMDYGNILIITQPSSNSCVQVIDGRSPSVSEFEQYDIQLAAGESDLGLIILDEQAPVPPEIVFGSEPEQGWCFYFEKASLAYQQGDWPAVLEYRKQARKMGYSAEDPVEWMPFLQAAVLLGDREVVLDLAPNVKRSAVLELQACKVLRELPGLDPETKDFVEKTFCRSGG